jgi:hypothetical protein
MALMATPYRRQPKEILEDSSVGGMSLITEMWMKPRGKSAASGCAIACTGHKVAGARPSGKANQSHTA